MGWLLSSDSGRKRGGIQEGVPVDLAKAILKYFQDKGLLKSRGQDEEGDE